MSKYAQNKRMSGEAYEGLKTNKDAKKWEYIIKIPRTIIERHGLRGKHCNKNSDKFACSKIISDQRNELFCSYWRMNWDQRRIYEGSMDTCNSANHQMHRVVIESHEHTTFKYHFRVDGILVPVCTQNSDCLH